ncbi:hypothetical protein [Marinicrinis lubricantis]|uniref:Hydrolase n=1 Tax=Marinicrinis lubricantis TaxID=2086470 RepID=A0ABW1IV88_9BACL
MKKTYFVSVQANSILEEKGSAAFEFEIQATDQELDQLAALFEEKEDSENATFRQAGISSVPYHELDDANDTYDATMIDVYKKIYELGTEETKRHIEQMGILSPA